MDIMSRYELREQVCDHASVMVVPKIDPKTREVSFLVFDNTYIRDSVKMNRSGHRDKKRKKFPTETQENLESPWQTLMRCHGEEICRDKIESPKRLRVSQSPFFIDRSKKIKFDNANEPMPFLRLYRRDWHKRNLGRHLRLAFLCKLEGDEDLFRRTVMRDESTRDQGVDLLGPPEWITAESLIVHLEEGALDLHTAVCVRALRLLADNNPIIEMRYSSFLFSHRPDLCKDDATLQKHFDRLDLEWEEREAQQRDRKVEDAGLPRYNEQRSWE